MRWRSFAVGFSKATSCWASQALIFAELDGPSRREITVQVTEEYPPRPRTCMLGRVRAIRWAGLSTEAGLLLILRPAAGLAL